MKKNRLEKVAARLSERLEHNQNVKVSMAYEGVKVRSNSRYIASASWVREVVETAEEFKMTFYIYQDKTDDFFCAMIHEF